MAPWRGWVQNVSWKGWRGPAIGIVALVVAVLLAGCFGFGGGSSQSVSDVHVESSGGEEIVVAFNYSVTAPTTATVTAPNGSVLTEGQLSPESKHSRLSLGGLQAGEYKLKLHQGGDTIASKTTSLEGANPAITAVNPIWDGNSLHSVDVTVQNNGDLPSSVTTGTVSVHGMAVNRSTSQLLPANESATVNISTTNGNPISITDAGTVNGSVEIRTDHGLLTESFQKTFDGANLTVTTVNATWNASRLKQVNVVVRNDGDLPTTTDVAIHRNGDQLANTADKQLPAGWTQSFEITRNDSIYTANFGEQTSFKVVANDSTHQATQNITRDIPPANITLESMTPVWKQGHLAAVVFNATNAENAPVDTEAKVFLSETAVSVASFSLPASSTQQFTVGGDNVTDALFTPTTRGPKAVELTLAGGGAMESETTTTVFSGQITSIAATFTSSYDDDSAQMDAVSFEVENTGYVPIGYDSAEISIDGTTRTNFLVYEDGLGRDTSTSEYLTTDVTVSAGVHDLTIRLINDGDVVLVESATVVTTQ